MAESRRFLRVLPFGLTMLVSGCLEEKSEAPATKAPKVVVAQSKSETVPLFLELTGRTEAPNTVSIRSRVDGHVESRPFTEGTDIRKGDTLFVIDQRPYKAELARLKGDRDRNKATLEFANRELDRFSALANKGAVAPEQLDQKTTNATEAKGNFDSTQGAVDSAQISLDYTTVSAPIDGRIGRVYQDVGNVVSANDTVLAELVQMDPLYVYVGPSEQQFLELERYRAINPDLKVTITLIDGSTHPHAGSLDFSNPGIDPTTGTIAVRTVFPNPERTLRPGQYARVQIQLTEQQDQVTIPAEAVGQDQAGFFVFVVGKDDKAEMRRVTAGRIYEGHRIVTSGLKEGEPVIVQGQQRVRSGMTVRVEEPSAGSGDSKADG
ncbi:efflux RND transporter periplasmic adaptor subunit [Ruegeria sediminis]|uniref:Efflux RND transporter periplasmic adaptor subunit n=1 Tax=Ruegeria sediminis TaxID=2583820 RepID=A0ABY2WT07_9RHOB|nr:efflux RND transporter periplasmic adaptor subunit [Ruegeria sediminis]TMV04198.1 efflux RND transporter periplasmic adaptor subunit [Ruegeria sediminis]